jgi:hypothetical protein
VTHYERLGVAPDAGPDEIRRAYRLAARDAHPDRHGDASAARMAAVNEAWHVLGDAERRRRYDASLRASASSGAASADRVAADRARTSPMAEYRVPASVEPARFPWRFMGVLLALGVGFVLVGVILGGDQEPAAPDNILRPGDCVTLSPTLEAAEVRCDGPHDATVQVLVPFDQTCPTGTEPYRDRQGMGTACVVRLGA